MQENRPVADRLVFFKGSSAGRTESVLQQEVVT